MKCPDSDSAKVVFVDLIEPSNNWEFCKAEWLVERAEEFDAKIQALGKKDSLLWNHSHHPIGFQAFFTSRCMDFLHQFDYRHIEGNFFIVFRPTRHF